jgi:hypothetical protein
MPRGRPRKVVVEPVPSDSLQWEVAQELVRHCGVPGCSPRLHLEEASHIIEIMDKRYNFRSSDIT